MHSHDTFIPTPSPFLVDLFLNERWGPMPIIVRNSCKCKFVIIQKKNEGCGFLLGTHVFETMVVLLCLIGATAEKGCGLRMRTINIDIKKERPDPNRTPNTNPNPKPCPNPNPDPNPN